MITITEIRTVFPIMLAFALWPGQFGHFAACLILLLSLKMWPVFWAMIATAYERILPVFMASGAIEGPSSARSRPSCSSSPR